jgi:hypothetical protein
LTFDNIIFRNILKHNFINLKLFLKKISIFKKYEQLRDDKC